MTARNGEDKTELKVVGASGQISLGKEYAGRTVLIEQPEPGVWRIRTATVIPDNERWLHTPEMQAKLKEAFAWLAQNPARETTPEELESLRDR
jgi:hypothetical protein